MTTTPQFLTPEAARSRMRITLASMDHELDGLMASTTVAADRGRLDALKVSLGELAEHLALGPEPELCACPVCHRPGMRSATMCGYCWTKLTPPAKGELAPRVAARA